jgi:2-amino-4-hydroxy-6-hydroxymethyldihydropteridine diphosphokinase
MTTVYVGIGSNIDRHKSIARAVRILEQQFGALRSSPVYECAAVGFEGDPFYNLVVAFDTELSALEVVNQLDAIEHDCGRLRGSVSMAPRLIDLDLLLYGDLVDSNEKIRVPRSDILTYAFVLKPLTDIAPELQHPCNHLTYRELWERFDQQKLPLRAVPFAADYIEDAADEGC